MTIDFGLLPPEVNSGRLWSGPGSAPMMTAAAAWATLSRGIYGTALSLQAVNADLATVWMGSSALAMSASVHRYTTWLIATATQAEATATQARAAAAAYESALQVAVPPELVLANRAQLAALVATNVLGQNTAAIAATEAQYAEMWAQDAAAMFGYQAASAAATQLQAFAPPPLTTQPAVSLGAQAATPTDVMGVVQQILTTLNDPTTIPGLLNSYGQAFISSGPFQLFQLPIDLIATFSTMWAIDSSPQAMAALGLLAPPGAVEPAPPPSSPAVSVPAPGVNVGISNRVGGLSVPQSWATPPVPRIVVPLPPGAATSVTEGGYPMPLPLGVPRGGTPPKQERQQPEYGIPVRFLPRPPSGG